MGEAATAVVLETESSARARGAEPLAVLGPVALGAEATPPGHWPSDPEGYRATMKEALDRAGLDVTDIAAVVASACGSPRFDRFEAAALADLASDLPVVAPAGLTGRLAAGGIFRLIVSVLSLAARAVPPTARLDTPEGTVSVSRERREFTGRHVLQVGSGNGAGFAALVVSLP
jgi:3-oxoacyl-(acyl-carrier-protein) synthase